jgi:hypothetical protein
VWAHVAQSFDDMPEDNPVIAIKGARVTDYCGKQLTMDQDASYVVNPVHERSKELKIWYKEFNKDNLRPLNAKVQEERATKKLDEGRLICELNDQF